MCGRLRGFRWVGIADVLNHEGAAGGAEGETFFGERDENAAAQLAHDTIALVDHNADSDRVDDLIVGDLVDSGDFGIGDDDVLEGLVDADFGGDVFED